MWWPNIGCITNVVRYEKDQSKNNGVTSGNGILNALKLKKTGIVPNIDTMRYISCPVPIDTYPQNVGKKTITKNVNMTKFLVLDKF